MMKTHDKPKPSEREVEVEVRPHPYSVIIGAGVLDTLGSRVGRIVKGRRAFVVTDENVGPLYAEQTLASLRQGGFEAAVQVVPAGDATKSLETLAKLYDAVAEAGIDRTCPVIALGGGVVGDLTGFLAATWMRGVPFVQCATTVEADVDASVGGKTAVNHPRGKNMIGSFYQPVLVLIDTATLRTLSERDFRAGLAESVKHAVIRDGEFFTWHEEHADTLIACDLESLGELLERNVRIKAEIVAQDEREVTGVRALLNFGHTIGHAIETGMARRGEPWRHGEAVATGMIAAAHMSVRAGMLDRASAERIARLVERIGLPVTAPLAAARDEMWQLMRLDKKSAAGKIRFVLAERLGHAILCEQIEPAWIEAGLDSVLV